MISKKERITKRERKEENVYLVLNMLSPGRPFTSSVDRLEDPTVTSVVGLMMPVSTHPIGTVPSWLPMSDLRQPKNRTNKNNNNEKRKEGREGRDICMILRTANLPGRGESVYASTPMCFKRTTRVTIAPSPNLRY